MTVIENSLKVTGLVLNGLDKVVLPFTSKVVESYDIEASTLFMAASVDSEDKYILKSATGLTPPDRDIAIARTRSGGKYQGSNVSDREIVLLIVLNPDEDAGETPKFLRDQLYTMLNTGYDPKVRVTLLGGAFELAYVYAYVSKFEATIFDKDPAVQITFECLNPTFSSATQTLYPASTLDERYPNIYNPGTAETGFKFAVHFTGNMNRWFIKFAEDQSIGMIFDGDFEAGDTLRVSTIPGKRYVHVRKPHKKVRNKLGILRSDYEWLQLHPGMNNFVVPKKDNWDWKGNLSFTVKHWGI